MVDKRITTKPLSSAAGLGCKGGGKDKVDPFWTLQSPAHSLNVSSTNIINKVK